MNHLMYDDFLRRALAEDIGTGDVTTERLIPSGHTVGGVIRAKEAGLLCGLDLAARVFALLDPSVAFRAVLHDGDMVTEGEVFAELSGSAHAVLMGERTALNILGRLSGIATATRRAVEAVAHTKARITDTRKTTPLWRALEKYAVRVGGGVNHRMNLSDGVLIKDNHIVAAGGILPAVEAARRAVPHTLRVEVETACRREVEEALRAQADIIMLDNMQTASMREMVELIAGRALTEASGNMGSRDLAEVAETGVDYISVGALTHSVKTLDISMRLA